MATKTSLLGLTKPAYTEAADIAVLNTNFDLIDRAVGNGARGANLFVNSNFADPVNWRGQTEYIGNYARTIDGWGTDGANKKIVVANGYVRAETTSGSAYATIKQNVVNNTQYAGKTLTAAAYLRSNVTPRIYAYNGDTGIKAVEGVSGDFQVLVCTFTVPANISDGALNVRFQGKSKGVGDYVEVKWAALYEGSYTADTLPAYVIPDKRIEMIRCGVPMNPPNLLDNSDFTIGKVVNQRDFTSTTQNSAFIIDRWKSESSGDGSVAIGNEGLSLTPTGSALCGIYQKIPEHNYKTGAIYTFAVCVNNVWECCQFNMFDHGVGSRFSNGLTFFSISGRNVLLRNNAGNSPVTIQRVALYEGAYDADTLPAYHYKGYAAELAECRRYYQTAYRVYGTSIGNVSREAIVLSPPMRITPTVSTVTEWAGSAGAGYTVSSAYPDFIDISYTGWGNVKLALSADL